MPAVQDRFFEAGSEKRKVFDKMNRKFNFATKSFERFVIICAAAALGVTGCFTGVKSGKKVRTMERSEWLSLVGPKSLKIVQLGDSYASGPGAKEETTREQYAYAQQPAGCYTSLGNWGFLYSQMLKEDGIVVNFKSLACAEADTSHIARAQQSVAGGKVAPQIEGLEKDTDLVFLTIGLSDIDFMGIVENCYVLYSFLPTLSTAAPRDELVPRIGKAWDQCKALLDKKGTTASQLYNGKFKEKVKETMLAIAGRTDHARIVLIQYPGLDRDQTWPNAALASSLVSPVEALFSGGQSWATQRRTIPAMVATLMDKLGEQQRLAVDEANTILKQRHHFNSDRIILFNKVGDHFTRHEACPGREAGCQDPAAWVYDFTAEKPEVKSVLAAVDAQYFTPQKTRMYLLSPDGHNALATLLRDHDADYGDGIFGITADPSESAGTVASAGVSHLQDGPLSYGNRGDRVKALQRKLLDLGLDLGVTTPTSFFGPKTTLAVKAVQRYKNIEKNALDENCNIISNAYVTPSGIYDSSLDPVLDQFLAGDVNLKLLKACYSKEAELSPVTSGEDVDGNPEIRETNNATNSSGTRSGTQPGGSPNAPGTGLPPTGTGGNGPSNGANTPYNGGNTPYNGGNTPYNGTNTPSNGGNTNTPGAPNTPPSPGGSSFMPEGTGENGGYPNGPSTGTGNDGSNSDYNNPVPAGGGAPGGSQPGQNSTSQNK
jgi:hypothetical protein